MATASPLSAREQNGSIYRLHNWGVPAVVGVLLLTLWGLMLVVVTLQKGRLMQSSQTELAYLRSAVAQHALGLFGDVDTDLRVIDRWLRANPRVDPRTDGDFRALVSDLRDVSQGLIDLQMVSTQGKLLDFSPADRNPTAAGADREYSAALLAKEAEKLRIGDPVPDPASGEWSIPVFWRLEKPVSGIAVFVARIDVARLIELHDSMRFKPNGAIVLIRADGKVLSRAPYDRALMGRDVKGAVNFQREYGVKAQGFFVSDGAVSDGVARLISYQRLEHYPVTILVNRGLDDVMSVFELRRTVIFSLAAVLTLLALAFTWKLHRSQRALWQAQRQLQRMEATDSLTGVMSRRAFLESALRELHRARRYQRPAAFLLLDLDHFKEVNDLYGHPIGDRVLRDCALAWQATLRDQDVLGRLGGEEFCAILPETTYESAKQVAERMRIATTELSFKGNAVTLSVTVSIGLAMVSADDAELDQLIERADRALYRAKSGGRNRVEAEELPLDAKGGKP